MKGKILVPVTGISAFLILTVFVTFSGFSTAEVPSVNNDIYVEPVIEQVEQIGFAKVELVDSSINFYLITWEMPFGVDVVDLFYSIDDSEYSLLATDQNNIGAYNWFADADTIGKISVKVIGDDTIIYSEDIIIEAEVPVVEDVARRPGPPSRNN